MFFQRNTIAEPLGYAVITILSQPSAKAESWLTVITVAPFAAKALKYARTSDVAWGSRAAVGSSASTIDFCNSPTQEMMILCR